MILNKNQIKSALEDAIEVSVNETLEEFSSMALSQEQIGSLKSKIRGKVVSSFEEKFGISLATRPPLLFDYEYQ